MLIGLGALGAFAALGVAIIQVRQRRRISELEEKLGHEEKKREADRKGRIQAERMLAKRSREANDRDGHSMQYIGWVESPFPDRRGTPRQPVLVPAARGRIKFDRRLVQKEAFAELAEFSHIFVIFVFHENTNIDKMSGNGISTSENKAPPSKIAPPRLGGKKVGCLTTRSPHRPNPIGLSVCEILGVGDDFIEISSIDFVHGTPVLDVKPVLPYDMVATDADLMKNLLMAKDENGKALQQRKLTVPAWITESDIPMRRVVFMTEAEESLRSVILHGGMRYSKSYEHGRDLIVQCLRQDVRGVHQGRGEATSSQELYMCRLDTLEINFQTTADNVLVRSVQCLH